MYFVSYFLLSWCIVSSGAEWQLLDGRESDTKAAESELKEAPALAAYSLVYNDQANSCIITQQMPGFSGAKLFDKEPRSPYRCLMLQQRPAESVARAFSWHVGSPVTASIPQYPAGYIPYCSGLMVKSEEENVSVCDLFQDLVWHETVGEALQYKAFPASLIDLMRDYCGSCEPIHHLLPKPREGDFLAMVGRVGEGLMCEYRRNQDPYNDIQLVSTHNKGSSGNFTSYIDTACAGAFVITNTTNACGYINPSYQNDKNNWPAQLHIRGLEKDLLPSVYGPFSNRVLIQASGSLVPQAGMGEDSKIKLLVLDALANLFTFSLSSYTEFSFVPHSVINYSTNSDVGGDYYTCWEFLLAGHSALLPFNASAHKRYYLLTGGGVHYIMAPDSVSRRLSPALCKLPFCNAEDTVSNVVLANGTVVMRLGNPQQNGKVVTISDFYISQEREGVSYALFQLLFADARGVSKHKSGMYALPLLDGLADQPCFCASHRFSYARLPTLCNKSSVVASRVFQEQKGAASYLSQSQLADAREGDNQTVCNNPSIDFRGVVQVREGESYHPFPRANAREKVKAVSHGLVRALAASVILSGAVFYCYRNRSAMWNRLGKPCK